MDETRFGFQRLFSAYMLGGSTGFSLSQPKGCPTKTWQTRLRRLDSPLKNDGLSHKMKNAQTKVCGTGRLEHHPGSQFDLAGWA